MAIHEQTASSPTSNENAFTQVLTRVHSVKWEYVAYAAILVLALMTRFIGLGDRVMSHDESLHTYYSWRLYEFGEFSHTPLMHGPVLFHMVALSYFMFGDSDFTARLYPAVLGILMVFYPVLLRRWIGRVGALLASVMMLISPMIMFHNRYIREDTPSVFFTMIMVYAALQYIDGVRPRRPVWLVVLAGSLLLTLASKEVAFIYIAIFGSYWLLVWLMRIVQDVGIVRRPADVTAWEPPLLQQFLGHVILLVMVGVLALTVGRFIRFLFSPILWIPSNAWIEVPLFLVLYVPLALSGMLRRRTNGADLTELAEGSKPKRGPRGRGGVASAIMQGVASGKSTLFLALVGLILGAIMALWIACVIDVIKPDQVWTQNIVRSGYDQMSGANMSKEYALSVGFESSMFIRLMSWVMLPAMVMMFVVFITAVFGFPRDLPLPWREILIILLIAFLVTSFLVMFERRSFVSSEESQPFAASLTAAASTDDGKYDNISIYMVWVLGSLITLGVVASRFLTNWWQMLNRQPIFDVLIIIGSLALPWLAAFPLYWAGYELENYDPNSTLGQDTFRAALLTVIPFFMVSASVGLSWNW
ncbi:MAG: TIGR03663 family protein, partial [Chloroflexi bacterium]|nr:TIGR03663 family protein [Chloroflexota bacterium]